MRQQSQAPVRIVVDEAGGIDRADQSGTLEANNGMVNIPLALTNGNENPIRITYETSIVDGEDTAEFNDFNPRSQTTVITSGNFGEIVIPIVPDPSDGGSITEGIYEGDETFTVTITNIENATGDV